MKIHVDLNVCTGHARCQAVASAVYATDDVEGKAVLIMDEVHGDLEGVALKGAKSCPERAITIHDTESGIVLWPPMRR